MSVLRYRNGALLDIHLLVEYRSSISRLQILREMKKIVDIRDERIAQEDKKYPGVRGMFRVFMSLGPTLCCDEYVEYATVDDVPLENVICSCGKSYFIKYEAGK